MNFGNRPNLPLHMALPAALALCLAAGPILLLTAGPAAALSELKRETVPPGDETAEPGQPPAETAPGTLIPLPDATSPSAPAADEEIAPQPDAPQDAQPGTSPDDEEGGIARPGVDPSAPPPEVVYDLAKLPEPVRRMHNLLVAASATGDIEKLRPLLGTGNHTVQLSLADDVEDPIAFLKAASGDDEGQEILAIMEEVLNAGYVHLDAGTPEEIYAWPYFFGLALDKLTPRQRVELFKIITAGDYDEMRSYNAYIFYRLGITPAGEWRFFVTGE